MSIYYPYTVLVNGDKSTLTDDKGKKKDIYLYMGDKNIDYYFTVKEASFNFRKNEGTNIIEQTSPSHAAVSLLKPDGTYVCGGKQPISKDQIKFTITPEMIDEITEVGDHTIVISLLDEENDSIATIPPIEGQMHILERVTPLPGADITTNAVNEAVVSLAQTTTEDEVLNVFDDNGNYIKTVWSNGDRITQERLNKVEEGIYQAIQKASIQTGLQLSQSRPEGARAWIQPTYPSYAPEFHYIDKWTANTKFVKNSDNSSWIATPNEGTSCNENKIYIGNVKELKLTNNTSTDLSYFGYFKGLDGSLYYSGGSIKAGATTIIYCTLNGQYKYENVKLYVQSLINSGDITVEAIHE